MNNDLETITIKGARKHMNIAKNTALGFMTAAAIFFGGCAKPSTPTKVYEDLSASFAPPIYTSINGSSENVIPNAKIELIGNGMDVTVSPGEKANLGQLVQGKSAEVTIKITGTNAYTAYFKYAMKGNMTFPAADLANTTIVNPETLVRITPTTTNVRYDQSVLNIGFNADPNTGLRLSDVLINAILEGYNEIKARSRGKIATINVDRNANQAYGVQPNEGEGRVFRTPDGNGVGTIDYTKNGALVSFVFKCDPITLPGTAKHETLDNLLGGNVSATISAVANELEFRFARNLNDAFYADHEERNSYPTTYGQILNGPGARAAEFSDSGSILNIPIRMEWEK